MQLSFGTLFLLNSQLCVSWAERSLGFQLSFEARSVSNVFKDSSCHALNKACQLSTLPNKYLKHSRG